MATCWYCGLEFYSDTHDGSCEDCGGKIVGQVEEEQEIKEDAKEKKKKTYKFSESEEDERWNFVEYSEASDQKDVNNDNDSKG